MKGSIDNNDALAALREQYPKLTVQKMIEITGFSYGFVYAWTYPAGHPRHRIVPDIALRLIRFELGLARASFLGVKKYD